MTSVDSTLKTRGSQHGDWQFQSQCARALKSVIIAFATRRVTEYNLPPLSPGQLEALDMVAVKQSRIICGNPNYPDHWHDVGGYARLEEVEAAAREAGCE